MILRVVTLHGLAVKKVPNHLENQTYTHRKPVINKIYVTCILKNVT